jgi:hypothetical protein
MLKSLLQHISRGHVKKLMKKSKNQTLILAVGRKFHQNNKNPHSLLPTQQTSHKELHFKEKRHFFNNMGGGGSKEDLYRKLLTYPSNLIK